MIHRSSVIVYACVENVGREEEHESWLIMLGVLRKRRLIVGHLDSERVTVVKVAKLVSIKGEMK